MSGSACWALLAEWLARHDWRSCFENEQFYRYATEPTNEKTRHVWRQMAPSKTGLCRGPISNGLPGCDVKWRHVLATLKLHFTRRTIEQLGETLPIDAISFASSSIHWFHAFLSLSQWNESVQLIFFFHYAFCNRWIGVAQCFHQG